jgi:hypothetical protein
MPTRIPITMDDSGNLRQLKRNDKLSASVAGDDEYVTRGEFEALQNRFRLLLIGLRAGGYDLNFELISETEQYSEKR